ncbi:MAG: hypothetical protein MUF64_17635 [Polyangiaceae bacterium]|nr:hypothetical protein [Polyangiaceae bacterium]
MERADLGAWELRVYEAVRVLILLDRGEHQRASQLAPLALPTGDKGLDRRLGLLMVRAAWGDAGRLEAVERGLYAAGAALHDLVLLIRVRLEELAEGQVRMRFSHRVCRRVCEVAVELGEEELASRILASSSGDGAYR